MNTAPVLDWPRIPQNSPTDRDAGVVLVLVLGRVLVLVLNELVRVHNSYWLTDETVSSNLEPPTALLKYKRSSRRIHSHRQLTTARPYRNEFYAWSVLDG